MPGFSRIGRGVSRYRGKSIATINVTSLLDITMTLLIAFMIVAPTLNYGIDVQLPEVEAKAVKTEKDPLVVSVSLTGGKPSVFLGERKISVDELSRSLAERKATQPDVVVVIQGDKNVSWETMAEVIGAVQRSGVEGVSLLTTPPDK